MGGSPLNDQKPTCWYISQTWGVHDHRWVTALADLNFEPLVLSLERDGLLIENVRYEIAEHNSRMPIIAGPLQSIMGPLRELPNPKVGLSWAFDLLQPEDPDLSWLVGLDHLIVDSIASRAVAIDAGMRKDQISTLPWGIDTSLFTPEGPKAPLDNLGIAPESPIVLSLRSLEPLYQVQELLEAWPFVIDQHPHTVLLVGNDGSLLPELQAKADESGIASSVRFIGRIPESHLPPLMRAAHVYVSTSPIDGSSVTMLQAMGCQTPIIATATPGNQAWVEPGETGRLYEPGNAQDLAQQISDSLVVDALGNTSMGVAARRSILTNANWYENRRQITSILESI